jgi:predicted O-methyltransferase YrrM
LDYNCEVFQTLAFAADGELSEYRNEVTNTEPMFWHGNGHTPMDRWVKAFASKSLSNACAIWKNDLYTHQLINEAFTDAVNQTPKLKEYRDWIESNIFGFGERSFIWLWNLLSKEHPKGMDFLEIGVFRGQSLAAIKLCNKKNRVTGITPMDATGGHWESNYENDIRLLHEVFALKQPQIIKGLSTDAEVMEQAAKNSYDVIYIDGGHTYEVAKHDVQIFSSFVRIGGYLVIDDCANNYPMPEGYFKGIEPVSRAVDELLPNDYYQEVLSVVHIRVFKRVK